ncbi:MAG: alpha/beta hydrolase, partial [Thermomicrobiales bacterium]|nr:alpha/beta hydrolase [Thermomicrobiales bacterium]
GTYEQPLRLSHGGWAHGEFERVLIACHDFHSLLDAGLPQLAFTKEPGWRIEHLPTGHWPMWSMPKELTEILAT